jgi:hypothetical protein
VLVAGLDSRFYPLVLSWFQPALGLDTWNCDRTHPSESTPVLRFIFNMGAPFFYLPLHGPFDSTYCASANMPPAQAQALATSQPLSDDCHSALNLTYTILSLLFIVLGLFFACRSIIRRLHAIHDHAHHSTTLRLPRLLSNEEWRVRPVRKRASPTVSTLAAQSTVVASSPLHLNISELGPPPTRGRTVSLLSGLCPLRKSRAASGPRQPPNGSNGNVKEHAGPEQHLSDPTDPVADTDGPEPDIHVPDTIDIPQILYSMPSAGDTQFKTETPMIPFIILSLPSSEHLVADPSPPVSLDEDLLSPNGTFRSRGLAADDTHYDLGEATLPLLASRLRERRKRPVSFPSPNMLSTPGLAYWPRWF